MYGLSSREALSKRQSRWVQDIDKEVRSNPVQSVFTRDIPSNPIRDKPSLITVMADEHDHLPLSTDSGTALRKRVGINVFTQHLAESEDTHAVAPIPSLSSLQIIATLQGICDELQQRCAKLEQDYESLKQSISDKTETAEIRTRIQRLEEISARGSSLVSNSTSGRSTDIEFIPSRPAIPHPHAIENSSEFSALTEPDLKDVYEFIPFVIKEEYAGRDNRTKLTGLQFNMLVELIGNHNESLIVYPFGNETQLPEFADCTLQLTTNNEQLNILGQFKRREDGIYIITLDESKLKSYSLPLILQCQTNLATR